MTGYYLEIFFPSNNIRYIAIADDIDTLKGTSDFAPFKNILNDMYARDISKKSKTQNTKGQSMGCLSAARRPMAIERTPVIRTS